MPRLHLADWIVSRLAELERFYGEADLMIADRREWAVTELRARKTPVDHGEVIVYVGGGTLIVLREHAPLPVAIVTLDSTTGG